MPATGAQALLVQRSQFTCSCTFSELALVKLRLAEADGLVLDEQFTANGVDLQIALGEAHLHPCSSNWPT
jgi:putative IMPACT (imprinted ancient) family translation regulator